MQANMSNLKDQILTDDKAIMLCRICGEEYNAHLGDYFMLPEDYVFKCCEEPMDLVIKKTSVTYEEVKR